MKDIKKIFYESIVPEAMTGKVKAYSCCGIVFNTNIYAIQNNMEINNDIDMKCNNKLCLRLVI